jgi:DNA-binding transcriptional MerR regulator
VDGDYVPRRRSLQEHYICIGQLAARLGVPYWRIKYAHAAGHVPEPLRVGTRRLYTEQDIENMAIYFGLKKGERDDVQLQG